MAIANGIVVPICNTSTATSGSCTKDLFLRMDVSAAHLVIDVTGYMAPPVATARDCERLSAPFSAAIGTQFNIGSPRLREIFQSSQGILAFATKPLCRHGTILAADGLDGIKEGRPGGRSKPDFQALRRLRRASASARTSSRS